MEKLQTKVANGINSFIEIHTPSHPLPYRITEPECCSRVFHVSIHFTFRPDTGSSTVRMTYLTNRKNSENAPPQPENMTPQINSCEYFAIGNSRIDRPFQKVVTGRTDFMNVVDKYSGVQASESNNEALSNELLEFLRSTKRYIISVLSSLF